MGKLKIDNKIIESYTEIYFAQDKFVPYSTKSFIDKTKERLMSLMALQDRLSKLSKVRDLQKNEIDTLSNLKKEIQSIFQLDSEIKIYPIQLKDYHAFISHIGILQVDKEDLTSNNYDMLSGEIDDVYSNSIRNKMSVEEMLDIFSKNNLEIVFYLKNNEDSNFIDDSLKIIFSLSFHLEINKIEFKHIEKDLYLILNDKIILSDVDFDNLRKIINYQNFPDFSDKKINLSVKQEIETYNRMQMKKYQIPSLEDRVSAFCVLKNIKSSDVWDMTIRRFLKEESMIHAVQGYILNQIALSNGATIKGGVEHFLYKKKVNDNHAFANFDETVNKFKN